MNDTQEQSVVSEQDVVDAVRKHLKGHQPGGATLEVVPQGIRQHQDWWYVPVLPSVQPPKRFEYYEALANVEKELLKAEHLIVLLVPTVPDAELASAEG
jgi:hypothetical protein